MPIKERKQQGFPLSDRITNGNIEDLAELANYLSNTQLFDVVELKNKFHKKIPEIQDYGIEYLGGERAHHYLLTNPITLEKYVLKITTSLSAPEPIDHAEVKECCVTVFSSRTVGSLTISLCEFCTNGTLLEYGKNISDLSEKINNVLKMHEQLADVLLKLGKNNTLLPDMKPTHLFITRKGKIVIANTKSLMKTTNGQFNIETMRQNPFYAPGPGFEPPEIQQ